MSINKKDYLPFFAIHHSRQKSKQNLPQKCYEILPLAISTALLLRKSIRKEINNILLSNIRQKISNCAVSVGLEAKFGLHLARVDVYSVGETL